MLTLPIKKQWFDMILSGEKKDEYRDMTPYYTKRFMNLWKDSLIGGQAERKIKLRNGYGKNAPTATVTVTISTGLGKLEWGAIPGKHYFILHIQSVEAERGIGDV